MKRMIKAAIALAMTLCTAFALSGCLAAPADDLFMLPKIPDTYVNLQNAIGKAMGADGRYSAPASGNNRSVVSLIDLNSDGQNEAIAYLYMSKDSKPLKIVIFCRENNDYVRAAVLESEGTGIDSVSYEDLNGDGSPEIIVGWQISSEVKMLSVYSIRNFRTAEIASTDYRSYTVYDITGDGISDLNVIRMSGLTENAEVKTYSLMKDGEVVTSTANLSTGITGVSRARTGTVKGGKNALYVESTLNGGGIVTDIFVNGTSGLTNITLKSKSGISEDTVRTYPVYCTDLDGDGVLEVPITEQLPNMQQNSYYMVNWYDYDKDGAKGVSFRTYHNYTDGWYLLIPREWQGKFTVRREDMATGERAVVFSFVSGEEILKDFMTIYAFNDEKSAGNTEENGLFIIKKGDGVIYAGELLVDADSFELPVGVSMICDNFNLIYTEWVTGAM